MDHETIELRADDRAAMRAAFVDCQRRKPVGGTVRVMLLGGPLDGLVSVECAPVQKSQFIGYCRPTAIGVVQVFYRRDGPGRRRFDGCRLMA